MWDAVTLYDFRAHVFVNTGFINNVWASSYYLGYPLLTSLSHTIVYLSGGNNPQFIYSLFYLSLGLTFYGSLREFIDRRLSLTFTMLLLVTPIIFGHSIIAYTNLPFTVYFGLGTLFYYIGLMKKNSGLTVLAWSLVGLSIWTRSIEPFWLGMVFIAFATMLFQKKFIALLKIILALFTIFVIFAIFRGFLPKIFTIRIGSTLPFSLFNFLNFERWILVFKYIFETIIQPWGMIFYSFVFALILTILNKMKNLFLLFFIALVFMGMLFAAIFVNSFLEVSGNWLAGGDATTRLSMFMYPVLIFCIALTVGKYYD